MKKLLLLILIGLLLILSIFIVIRGVGIGNIEVLGIKGIQTRSNELDEKIQEASKLVEKDYKQAVSKVTEDSKTLEKTKQEYNEMTLISSEGDVQAASQIEKYEIETLWVKLGNHATSEGAIMKMDVTKGTTNGTDTYDLKFTVNGSYISITDFISDIENDSTLGFKIEEFKMTPNGEGNTLEATFVCRDIAIKDVSQTTIQNTANESGEGTENAENSNNTTNTSNTTNTTNTSNTTNSTNTLNTTNNTNTSNTNR